MGHTMTKQSWEWKKSEQEEFRLYLVSQERSENTVEKYLRDVRRFCAHIGKDTIGDIEREDVLCYKKWLLERYKTASVNSMLAALNCCFRFLKRDELCVQNCRVQRLFFAQEEREMSREEYFCLVREARRQGMEREAAILQTMASTGVRVSELPFITAEAVRERVARIQCKGKERVILLPQSLVVLLRDYCRRQGIRTGSIFITRNGRPVDRRNVWAEMKALCEKAGVEARKVFPHNLRHLFARCFYEREKNLVRLADYLGHSSVETTRRYTMTAASEECRSQLELGLTDPIKRKKPKASMT